MKELWKSSNWFAGLQWLFFIFTNIVVIPITVGAAFQLPAEKIVALLQLSFIITGLACVVQAVFGHRRALMEGQSGLWWGVFLTLVNMSAAQGISLEELGGSLAVGIIISGIITFLIGLSGIAPKLSKLFNPAVMGVFIFLLGVQLVGIFLKGMLGIPFGTTNEEAGIHVAYSLLSIVIVILVIIINLKASIQIRRYGLLIGIIVGWILFVLLFKPSANESITSFKFELFPLGKPAFNIGIILTAVFAGMLNIANTFGALKGSEVLYDEETSKSQYRGAFSITGVVNIAAGMFGLVPYAPYVSSIGFLIQSNILKRLPFILGGAMFMVMGLVPAIGAFFSKLPLSIGSAVLFVAYLLLFQSAWGFFNQVKFNMMNVYRVAIPVFVGITIMTMPASYFDSIPMIVRPLLSSGLLVGILLALILENTLNWDKIGLEKGR